MVKAISLSLFHARNITGLRTPLTVWSLIRAAPRNTAKEKGRKKSPQETRKDKRKKRQREDKAIPFVLVNGVLGRFFPRRVLAKFKSAKMCGVSVIFRALV